MKVQFLPLSNKDNRRYRECQSSLLGPKKGSNLAKKNLCVDYSCMSHSSLLSPSVPFCFCTISFQMKTKCQRIMLNESANVLKCSTKLLDYSLCHWFRDESICRVVILLTLYLLMGFRRRLQCSCFIVNSERGRLKAEVDFEERQYNKLLYNPIIIHQIFFSLPCFISLICIIVSHFYSRQCSEENTSDIYWLTRGAFIWSSTQEAAAS